MESRCIMEMPDWVPLAVARIALMMAGLAGYQLDVVRRLAADPRMKEVWDELRKHQRENHVPTKKLRYSPILPAALESWGTLAAAQRKRAEEYAELGGEASATMLGHMAASAEARQSDAPPSELSSEGHHQMALATLFAVAVATYLEAPRTVTQKEVESVITGLELTGKEQMAAGFRRQAVDPENARFISTRHRTEPRLEAFVERVGSTTTKLFGNPLYGVIARIANVAFERSDLTRPKIRAMLRS
jgi:hypothetical protein